MKNVRKGKKLSTEEALQRLLGRKAAKRIRQVAETLADHPKKKSRGDKKAKKKR